MASFDVFTVNVFNKNHVSYQTCLLLAQSLYKLKSSCNDIHLKCVTGINRPIPQLWNRVAELIPLRCKPAARVVSSGYDLCLKKMVSDYVIFCHSDTVMLHKNWDKIIIDLLEKYKMVGVPYFNGNWNTYPSPIFCCAKRETWQQMNISFSAQISNNRIIRRTLNKEDSKIFNMNVGDVIKLDVGWQIPSKLNDLRYNSYIFTPMLSEEFFKEEERLSRTRANSKKSNTEWSYNSNLFFAHFQAVRAGRGTRRWIDRVRNFLDRNSN